MEKNKLYLCTYIINHENEKPYMHIQTFTNGLGAINKLGVRLYKVHHETNTAKI